MLSLPFLRHSLEPDETIERAWAARDQQGAGTALLRAQEPGGTWRLIWRTVLPPRGERVGCSGGLDTQSADKMEQDMRNTVMALGLILQEVEADRLVEHLAAMESGPSGPE